MKTKHILISVIVLVFIFSYSAEKPYKLDGTWELVSGKYVFSNNTIEMPGSQYGHAIKVINKTHFATIHQDTSKKEIFSNAGTYILSRDTYTENLEFATGIKSIGTTLVFDSKIEGDTWTLSGPTNITEITEDEVYQWTMHEVWKKNSEQK